MKIKPQIRILGIDDGSLCGEEILLVGVVFRGGFWIDGLLSCWIERDGTDATDKIINMVSTTKHEDLRVIMTDGITFAGFNTIDIQKIAQKTSLGIIPVMRKMPDFEKIDRALDNFPDKKERWHCIERAGPVHSIPVHRGVTPSFLSLCGLLTLLLQGLYEEKLPGNRRNWLLDFNDRIVNFWCYNYSH